MTLSGRPLTAWNGSGEKTDSQPLHCRLGAELRGAARPNAENLGTLLRAPAQAQLWSADPEGCVDKPGPEKDGSPVNSLPCGNPQDSPRPGADWSQRVEPSDRIAQRFSNHPGTGV
jgi:hypothetical protein